VTGPDEQAEAVNMGITALDRIASALEVIAAASIFKSVDEILDYQQQEGYAAAFNVVLKNPDNHTAEDVRVAQEWKAENTRLNSARDTAKQRILSHYGEGKKESA